LQHPLGVTLLPDGAVAVLDTFNGAVRRWDGSELTTLLTGLAEPSGAVVVDRDLLVVESAAHQLIRHHLASSSSERRAEYSPHRGRPPVDLRPGTIELDVVFTPAPGRVLDDRFGPSTRLTVSASPPELLRDGAGESTELRRTLQLADGVTAGVLHVTAQAASCDHDPGVENPACDLARQDWGVPIRLVPDGTPALTLMLLG
jgi:hypothetical protein